MNNRPIFPKNRVISTKQTIDFFGFKLTKVKHVFFFVCYFVSMVLAFLVMIVTQDDEGFALRYFVLNVLLMFIRLVTMFISYLYKNWNKPIN